MGWGGAGTRVGSSTAGEWAVKFVVPVRLRADCCHVVFSTVLCLDYIGSHSMGDSVQVDSY